MKIAEQERCMCEQVRIDAVQLTGLAQSLLAGAQKLLNLPVQVSNVCEQLCWGTLGVGLGERRCCLVLQSGFVIFPV